MKLIILLPNLGVGGTERMVSKLANDLTELGLEVVILLMAKKKKGYFVNSKVRILEPNHQLKSSFLAKLRTIGFLRRQIVKEKPDSILNMGYILIGIIVSLNIDVRLIISWRRSPYRKRFPKSELLEFLYKFMHQVLSSRVDGVIAQTQVAKRYYRNRYSCDIEVIPNYVSVNSRRENTKRKKIILNVGRFITSKNQLELVRIFKKLTSTQGWGLYFLGDGEMKTKVQEEADWQTKENFDIQFLGNVKNVDEWYFSSPIFAFTSLSEGFPNALAEAMAAGCACIAYDCVAGPSDIIDDGINGFLIPVGDETQYKEKLELLMEDSDLRDRFGEAAREKMKAFEASKIARKFYEFISQPLK